MIRVGESAFLLELGRTAEVLAAQRAVEALGDPAIVDLIPGASTLLVVADALTLALPDESQLARIERAARDVDAATGASAVTSTHEIAVRYDGEDLAELAARAGLAVDEVIARHAAATYRVAFVGFQPGFAYLDGLPPELHVARRSTPRPRVPAGSVAIGGAWTGIYPLATPGGWNIVATTDATLFDARRASPALLQPGDAVRFVPR